MMNKLLSIIIPTYNMEALLDQCLTSLILETEDLRERLDVIVVIDGATDRSSEIAHQYADRYPEMFSVIDKENGNYGSCINVSLPLVKGKYVRILDADDSYVKEELPAYLDMLEEQNADMVLTDFETVNAQGERTAVEKCPFKGHKTFILGDIPEDYFIPMHAVAYRSDIFKRIDYYQTEGVSYTDAEWVFKPLSEVKAGFYYNRIVYRYLVGREGQTVDPHIILKSLPHIEKGLWNMLKAYGDVSDDNKAKGYMHRTLLRRLKRLYLWGMDKNATLNLDRFDRRLKSEYPIIYRDAAKITIPVGMLWMQMPIVKMWRKVRSRKGLYLFPLYDLYVLSNEISK